jgi:hypothetical protein
MQSSRSTKKYCSDACKQAAFYSRAAQPQISRVTVNDKNEALDDDELSNVTVSEKQYIGETTEYAISVNDEMQFGIEYEDKAPPEAKQPYCIPIVSGKRLVATSLAEEQYMRPLPLNVTKKPGYSQSRPLNDKLNSGRFRKSKLKNYVIEEDDEEKYEWVRCELLDEVEDYFNDNYKTTEMFQYPKKYWYSSDLEKVKWVSVRLRNIIENMLEMDRRRIDRRVLRQLNDALQALIASFNFRYMPRNYPLKNEMISLQKTLQQVVAMADRTIRFTLARPTKIKLMAIRFQLADLVPASKFRQLDFSK